MHRHRRRRAARSRCATTQRQRTFQLDFDQLHVATGARPTRPDLPGIDGDRRARACRRSTTPRRSSTAPAPRSADDVVVVGGGYIGLEMAEAFVRRGAEVTLVEGGDQLMGTLDPDMAERLLGPLRGPRASTCASARRSPAFEPGRVHLDDGTRSAADLVVLGLGRHAQRRAGRRGRRRAPAPRAPSRSTAASARRSRACRRPATAASRTTSCPAGDVHIALGTVANKQGRVAGINLGGGYATFPGVVGTAITKVCELEVARTGLTEREAAAAGFEAAAATRRVDHPSPATCPTAADDGEAAGRAGHRPAARRPDRRRAGRRQAHRHHRHRPPRRIRVDELVDLDLAYAPPFGHRLGSGLALAARRLV